MIYLDTATVLSIFLSVVIPDISSAIANVHWSSWLVGALTLAISTLNGFILDWSHATDINHYDWKDALIVAAASYIVATISRVGHLKGTTLDAWLLSLFTSKKVGTHEATTITTP